MAKEGDGWLSREMGGLIGRWVAKLEARLLVATAALWVRFQTSLKNTKWATKAKEWPTNSSPPKNIKKFSNSIWYRNI